MPSKVGRTTKAGASTMSALTGYDAEPKGSFYPIKGEFFERVTSICGVMDKSGPLTWWAGNEERTLWRGAAAQLIRRMAEQARAGELTRSFSPERFIEQLEFAVGPTLACKRRLAAAGNIGTMIHNRIRFLIDTELGKDAKDPGWPSEQKTRDGVELALMAFADWRKKVELQPLAAEVLVFHPGHRYAGRVDLIAIQRHPLPGGGMSAPRLTVDDWKSGKAIYDEAHMQNVAYRVAALHSLEETAPAAYEAMLDHLQSSGEEYPMMGFGNDAARAVIDGVVVQFPKAEWGAGEEMPFEARQITDDPAATMLAFLGLQNAHRWMERMKERSR